MPDPRECGATALRTLALPELVDLRPRLLTGVSIWAWMLKAFYSHVARMQRRDGTFERADFVYDHADDSYICPGGNWLRQRRKVSREPRPFADENGLLRYRASKLDRDACGLKQRCTPNMPARKILRSVHEGARDLARI
jgi:hypothetical protein